MGNIKTDILRRFGLTKQMLDDSADVNFATLSVISNDLSRNEMASIQETLMHHYSTHVRQVLNVDSTFNKELKTLVTKHKASIISSLGDRFKKRLDTSGKGDEHIITFLMIHIKNNFVSSLPALRNEDENSLKTKFEAYLRNVEDIVDKMLFTDESMPSAFAGDEFSGIADAFKRSYKNMLIRKWLERNNYMTEVAEVLTVTDGVINIDHLTEYVGNLKALSLALRPYAGMFKKARKDLDKATINLMGDKPPEPETPPPAPVTTEEPEPEPETPGEPKTPTEDENPKEEKSVKDEDLDKQMNDLLDT
jgi:hypothetical protein